MSDNRSIKIYLPDKIDPIEFIIGTDGVKAIGVNFANRNVCEIEFENGDLTYYSGIPFSLTIKNEK